MGCILSHRGTQQSATGRPLADYSVTAQVEHAGDGELGFFTSAPHFSHYSLPIQVDQRGGCKVELVDTGTQFSPDDVVGRVESLSGHSSQDIGNSPQSQRSCPNVSSGYATSDDVSGQGRSLSCLSYKNFAHSRRSGPGCSSGYEGSMPTSTAVSIKSMFAVKRTIDGTATRCSIVSEQPSLSGTLRADMDHPDPQVLENADKETENTDRKKKGAQITSNYRLLKDTIHPEDMNDYMIQAGTFSVDDKEEVLAQSTTSRKADTFLQKVLRKLPESFSPFIEGLKKTSCHHVLEEERLEENTSVALRLEELSASPQHKARQILMLCKEDFLAQLMMPDCVLEFFLQYKILDLDSYESVFVQRTRREKAVRLLEAIFLTLPLSHAVLLLALEEAGESRLLNTLNAAETTVMAAGSAVENASQDVTKERETVTVKLEWGEFSTFVEGVKSLQMTIEVDDSTGNAKEMENRLVTELTQSMWRPPLQLTFLKHTQCSCTDVRTGSVVIRLKSCSPRSSRRINHLCKTGQIEKLVEDLLKLGAAQDVLTETTRLTVTLKATPSACSLPEHEDSDKVVSDDLRGRLAFLKPYLVRKLDLYSYLPQLRERGIVSDPEVDHCIHDPPSTRESRSRRTIECLMTKGEATLKRFLDFLEDVGQHDIVKKLTVSSQSGNKTLDLAFGIMDNYEMLLDEICPAAMEEIFTENGSLEESVFQQLSDLSRRDQAMILIIAVLTGGQPAQATFVDALEVSNCPTAHERVLASASKNESPQETEYTASAMKALTTQPSEDNVIFRGNFTVILPETEFVELSDVSVGKMSKKQSSFAGQFTFEMALTSHKVRSFCLAPLKGSRNGSVRVRLIPAHPQEEMAASFDKVIESHEAVVSQNETISFKMSDETCFTTESRLVTLPPIYDVTSVKVEIDFNFLRLIEGELSLARSGFIRDAKRQKSVSDTSGMFHHPNDNGGTRHSVNAVREDDDSAYVSGSLSPEPQASS